MNNRSQELQEAVLAGRCYTTADGWCALHSTPAGPVYHYVAAQFARLVKAAQ